MSQKKKQPERSQPARRRRRRSAGVPTLLTVALLVIALGAGALAGFALARRSDPNGKALAAAQTRTGELEQFLTGLGYHVTEDSPDTWTLAADEDALAAITSDSAETDPAASNVWDDQNVLQGMLAEDQEPVVVAEFEGGQVLSSEVIPAYNDELSTYIFDGYDPDEISGSLLQEVLTRQVGEKLKLADAAKQGLDTLTPEEEAAAKAEASAEYEDSIRSTREMVVAEGMSEEEIRAAAIDYLKENEDTTLESLEAEALQTKREDKYRDYVVRDVTVTDEEVQAHYDELLEQQKEDFDAVPDDFFYSHLYGSLVVYNPEGFRAVRDIQIPFENEADGATAEDLNSQIAALDLANQGDTYQALNEQLDALYAPLEAKAQEAVEKLNGGADFGALMDEYGVSDYLKDEPLHTQGYYLNSDSFINSEEYMMGAMELEKPGEVSVAVRSAVGVHLIQYVGDVTPGAIPFDQVRDAVRADLLEARQDEYYEQYIDDLISQTKVTYYTDRLQ